VQPADVALVADNSPRWLIADQGIITAGAVDVVQRPGRTGRTAVYPGDSGSTALVVEDRKTLKKTRSPRLLPIHLVVLLSRSQRQTKP